MNKKLTAKVQQLFPQDLQGSDVFAGCFNIEPQEKELVLKKGSIYGIYDLAHHGKVNLELTNKLINDVLTDAYYHSENVSPIQSLEKAVVELNDKLCKIPNETTIANEEQKTILNITAVVLWGNVLYYVQFGSARGFLMRNGEIKDITVTTEGNFSVSSGVIKDEDVVILSTKSFSEKFTPMRLLQSAISSRDLQRDEACLIMKFIVDTTFTQDEIIEFKQVITPIRKPKIVNLLSSIKERIPKRFTQEKQQVVQTIAEVTPESFKVSEDTKIKLKKSLSPRFNSKSKMLLGLAAISFLGAVILTATLNKNKPQETEDVKGDATSTENMQPTQTTTEVKATPQISQESTENDEKNKVKRVAPKVFYDIKLTDESANPKDIALFNQTVVVTDPETGKVFASMLDTPKFTAETTQFIGIRNIVNSGSKLNFSDNEGYKIYDLIKGEVVESYSAKLGLTDTYVGNIYSIEGTNLNKYVKNGSSLEKSLWSEDPAFSGAKSISVAYSIYIATANDELLAFTQGEKGNFEVTGLDTPFKNIAKVVASVDYDNIYVADAGNQRVVILNSDGALVSQIKYDTANPWNDMRSISISPDESKMFLLNGTRVYEIEL